MFDDLLGEKPKSFVSEEEAEAEAYAEEVNRNYRKLKKSSARFKFDLKKWGINEHNYEKDQEDEDFAEILKKAIDRVMRQNGKSEEEIQKEMKNVDKEYKKKICSDGDGSCEDCGGDCNEEEEDVWDMTGCMRQILRKDNNAKLPRLSK